MKVVKNLPGLKARIKANHSKIGPVYGKLSADIVKKILSENAENIVASLDKDGAYKFSLKGKKVKITKDMVEVEKEVPILYKESVFKNGSVYLNTERNKELEAGNRLAKFSEYKKAPLATPRPSIEEFPAPAISVDISVA